MAYCRATKQYLYYKETYAVKRMPDGWAIFYRQTEEVYVRIPVGPFERQNDAYIRLRSNKKSYDKKYRARAERLGY